MVELGAWVTNGPKDLNAPRVRMSDGRSDYLEQADYLAWRRQFVEGPPKATPRYTVAQLTEMGEIGLYWPAESSRGSTS